MAASDSTKTKVTSVVSSTGHLSTGTSTVTETRSFTVSSAPRYGRASPSHDVTSAVYAHIQAMRSLGREQVSADEIAEALGLPQRVVLDAVSRLGSRGVRVVR